MCQLQLSPQFGASVRRLPFDFSCRDASRWHNTSIAATNRTENAMQVTTAQLNEIARMLNTTDKQLVINVAIGTLVKAGVDIKDATDAVLGEGAYTKLAHQVYDALRA